MASKKKKMKVSKVKHSNQVITKLKKQGKIKSQRHRKKKVINRQPQKVEIQYPDRQHSDNDSVQGSDMMEMMEEDDLNYLLQSSKRNQKKKRKQNGVVDAEDENLEEDYESTIVPTQSKKQKQLLPIKTKHGIEMRSMDVEERTSKNPFKSVEANKYKKKDTIEENGVEEDELQTENDTAVESVKPLSASDLLLARYEDVQNKKLKIGVLCSGILENPEIKITNFFTLLYLMDDKSKTGVENLLTTRKLATVSLLEVFKDVLPDYQISQQDFGEVKLKKDTLALTKYESGLLAHYKRYLQRLERMASILIQKKGDTRKVDTPRLKLAHIAITCLCDLLVSHPYFNFSSNIAQMLVPFLNNKNSSARETVNQCFQTVFKNDKKGLISLMIVRKINILVKTRSNEVNCQVLDCMLALRIKDVNLDDEKKLEMKQKKQMSHKQRLISMSKKERKRNKKLVELEKEMLETKAEENKQTKQQNLTEIIKVVFTIYFRVLKRSPNSKLLSSTLEGLSKFAHIMNLDYYSDLVNLLNNLLEDDDLGYREQLHCVQTVFAVLSGQGDVLNIDPTRFYSHLYRNLLRIHAGKNHADLIIIVKALNNVLIMRRKKVSQQILLAFVKRVATLSTQVTHNGALACMGIIKTVMQHSKQTEILLELDQELGSGQYDPCLMEPEYCNANSSALYELAMLRKHYHPTVRTMALNIMNGVPSTGEGSLPVEINKLSPEQLFNNYDGSQMSFKPAIPPPKKVQPKTRLKRRHIYTHPNFEDYCKVVANKRVCGPFNFSEIADFTDIKK